MAIDGTKNQQGWKSVWLKAIALSWKDADFKKELLANAREALAHHFDYTLPNYIDLYVFDPTSPTAAPAPKPGPGPADVFGYYPTEGGSPWIMPNNQINLPLPPAPKNPDDQAIALASFSDSNNYPYTTC